MLRHKVYSKIKDYFEDYLFGFNKNQFEVSLFSGNVSLNNVNIRPDKINEIFEEQKAPFSLKAGMIGSLNFKMSIFSYFSNALQFHAEDILFIIGPNISHMGKESVRFSKLL